jgi:outer membrane biosynthesis protein TonB
MLAGRFVLENDKGEVVRSFAIDTDELIIIYRHDTRRVDVVSEVDSLKTEGVSFDILKRTTASTAKGRSIPLANGGRFKFTNSIDKTAKLINPAEDSEEEEKAIYKYTALSQIGAMLLILIIGLLIEPLFMKKEVEEVVTIIPQQFNQVKPRMTVKPSERVVQKPKYAEKKTINPVKPTTKLLQAKTKAVRRENAPLRTKVKVENMGALGALGGMKTGSKNSAGFNMNALNDSKGTSWNGAGAGGVGGMERAVHGKGIAAAAMGSGEKVEGGGGYGTRGASGGGRPGYGTMNMGGTAAAYFEPVTEEALVEGGLTKDQIAAVINRHMGEVIYCYEKGLQVNPDLAGRVSMKFVINGGGRVSSANVGGSSLNNVKVEACIVNRLRGWPFPKPVGGVNVKVEYPFALKRVNHG